MKTNMAAAPVNLPALLPPPPRFSIHDRFSRTTTIPNTRVSLSISNTRSTRSNKSIRFPVISCCLNSTTTESSTISTSPDEASTPPKKLPRVIRKRKMYRRQHPGEAEGIATEMRFVAMRLRVQKGKDKSKKSDENSNSSEMEDDDDDSGNSDREIDGSDEEEEEVGPWNPTLVGFMKYLVCSKLVFSTIERLVDESQDVSFAYFRNTGLERSESFTKDIEWLSQKYDVLIPNPSDPAKRFVKHLEELAAQNPPIFLCNFYIIYFSHVAGGQVIAKKVSELMLQGKELEICQWPGDPQELIKSVSENLNTLSQHWIRDVKNNCLRGASKSLMYMGTIIRLICAG